MTQCLFLSLPYCHLGELFLASVSFYFLEASMRTYLATLWLISISMIAFIISTRQGKFFLDLIHITSTSTLKPNNTKILFFKMSTIFIVNGEPSFKEVECVANEVYDLCIEVRYELDNETDLLLLNKVQNEDTVFEGHLKTEGSSVAVTIEDTSNPDDIEVIILNSCLPL